MKTCSKCEVSKEDSEFYLRSPTGPMWAHCKECAKTDMRKNYHRNPSLHRIAGQKWRAKNPAQHRLLNRASHLKRVYGLSLTGYEKMVTEQLGNCAICGDSMPEPHIDHCHSTGKIRALLCAPCNHGIGNLKDSATLCFLAASYLQKFSS